MGRACPGLRLAFVSLVALLATPAVSLAGTARVDSLVAGRGSETFRFVDYRAASGEANAVTVTVSPAGGVDVATLVDSAGVAPGPGCTRPNPVEQTRVSCILGSTAELTRTAPQAFRLFLADRDDAARVTPTPRVAALIDGGLGNDVLVGGTGGGVIDESTPSRRGNSFVGGAGDDTLVGGPNDDAFKEGGSTSNGRDTLRGGAGSDSVSYAGRRRRVRADLEGDRDDGERGERDLISRVENLTGGRAADRLTGNARANTLRGGGGRDVLRAGRGSDALSAGGGRTTDALFAGPGEDEIGGSAGSNKIDTGSGPDTVRANGGRDRILSRDRSPDEIYCGRGRDSARLDGLDWIPRSCERIRRRGTPRTSILDDEAGPLGGARRFYARLQLGCPADFPARRCSARVSITYRGDLIARGRVRLRRGRQSFEVDVFFTNQGNRVFEPVRGSIKARAKATTRLAGGHRVSIVRTVVLRGF